MFLAIDLGSSFIKYALIDESGNLGSVKRIKSPEFLASECARIKEYCPEDWVVCVKNIIDESKAINDIKGVFFSTQMHGMILMDGDGETISNYISWQDERAFGQILHEKTSYFDKINSKIKKRIHTGAQEKINLSLYPLFYFLNELENLSARFMMLGDFLAYRLTGKVALCHITNAASTGMVSLKENDWDKYIIDAVGAQNIDFPRITSDVCSVGKYKDADIYSAVGDHQASVLGCETNACDVVINIATGSQVSFITDEMKFGDFEMRPYFDGKYLLCDSDLPSGRDVTILASYLQKKEGFLNAWDYIDRTVSTLLKQEKETLSIDFCKLRANKFEYIENFINEGHTIDEIIYASLSGIIEKAYKSLCKMIAPEKVGGVLLSGGLPHSVPSVKTLSENIFNKKCSISDNKHEALSGLQQLALHFLKNGE